MTQEFWINIHYDQNGDLASPGMSHSDFDVAVEYADEDSSYVYSIHHSEGGKVSIVDLTDAIREHRCEAARERRHELSYSGAR